MWPFTNKNSAPIMSPENLNDAIDELGLVKLNGLNKAIDHAMKKHLDTASLDDFADDQGGYFSPEFNLVSTAGRMKAVYRREPWVYTTASLIARTLASIPLEVVDSVTGEVDIHHPLNNFLKAGNDLQDRMTKDWAGNLDLVLGGNFFEIIDGDKVLHTPVEYVNLRVADTDEERKKFGPILGIEIQTGINTHAVNKTEFIPWANVVHHKMPNPFNPYIGMSMISAAARPILLDRHKNEFEMAFYLRGATNSGVIETTEDITKTRMERLMRTFENSMTGRNNWFRQLFLPKGAKWVNSGLTMNEMQHLEGLRENRLTLLAVIGVPPMKVGIVQDVNRSTAEIQNKTFYENTIIPMAQMKAAGWNNSFLVKNKYKGEVKVVPNFDGIEGVEGGILTRAEQAKALDNVATINEQRKIAGLSPLKKTDPRGQMFAVELVRSAMPNPFGGEESNTGSEIDPMDIGPEDEPVGEMVDVEVQSSGDEPHTHMAEVDQIGNGMTTSTDGEGEKHEHEILEGEVQLGGTDGHTHPSISVPSEDEKTFRRIKAVAVESQENIEGTQSSKYFKAYQRHLQIKLNDVKQALLNGTQNIKLFLEEHKNERMADYLGVGIKVLNESMEKGFTLGQSQTRHYSKISKKVFEFSPVDELAIEIIQDSLRPEVNQLLEMRGIEHFFGFDESENNNILSIIVEQLDLGMTTESIAKNLEKTYGENYKDQAFTITRTETLFAISQGLDWQHETLKQVFTDVNKQWFHVGDVNSNPMARAEHADFENDGKNGVVPSNHVWKNSETGASLKFPRDPNAGAADVINCRCTMVNVIPLDAESNAQNIINS